MKFRGSACAWLAAATLAGCAWDTQYVGEVHVTSPELVAIQPGVEVINDADEPVFYTDGYYWLYRDDAWLRSDSYKTGYARVQRDLVPHRLAQLPEPQSYAHYRHSHHNATFARGGQTPQRPHTPSPPQPDRPVHPNSMPGDQPVPPQAPTEAPTPKK